jgi:Polyphosphate kinase 2 (PPK2)
MEQTMTDKRQKRVAEFIEPFRVKPGSKVTLGKDFDPSFTAGVKKKKDGVALLAEGVRLLTEYQARLAAQDTWGVLQKVFSEMLSHTSTEWAPWYVIPADRKWFGRIGAGAVLVHTLIEIDPQFPAVSKRQRATLLEVKAALEAQAPNGAAVDPFEQEKRGEGAKQVANADGRNGQPESSRATTSNGVDKTTAERTR